MSEHGTMLTEVATGLLRDRCTPEDVVAAEATGWSERLWSALAEAGFPYVSVPEEAGGSGGDVADACALLAVAGRFAAPVPLAESGLLAGWALAAAGLELPEGPASVAVGRPGDVVELSGGPGTWRLTARVQRVPWGGRSTRVVLLASVGGERYVVSAPTAVAQVLGGRNLAAEPRDTLSWDDVPLADEAVAPAPAGVDADALRLRGALGRAALISGALARVAELTVRYTGERQQFGRPVARFQAVQAHLVTIAEEAELARMAVEVAARNARPDPGSFDVAAAAAVTGEAATVAARAAHQAHGAIGMTKEYELGQLTRRLWSWRDEFGSERAWGRELGRRLAEAGADELWPRISRGLVSA
ncbi:acyl-CoA dehydrogenase [Blastococcus sp. MG754426]|uniref:acyl-CoA dehydrogenase family protein n=1 Tax=unclassified Blastococcus TaxID=2619396 RepID=UPI001EF14780|nr:MULTISPECIES: acyl-CoA dehydrogenase family protein [unclassified Blastococcus]MCF6508910.1 acyl-CoA dehydrogenase [Blastococcus sp. MG754426]MCF6513551.1 acyl-CoA dehydrogenase [Blastococcus sp. MG754427]